MSRAGGSLSDPHDLHVWAVVALQEFEQLPERYDRSTVELIRVA
jgi:hypothetical protein